MLKRIIAILAAPVITGALILGGAGVASANPLDGSGNYHTAYVDAYVACNSFAYFLSTYSVNQLQAAVDESQGAAQVADNLVDPLPANYQSFYNSLYNEIYNVYVFWVYQFRLDTYNAGLAYTGCTWVLAP